MAVKPLSLRAYAKRRGVTLQAVQKALQSGRIQALPSGKLDPAATDAAWDASTDASKQRKAASGMASDAFARARAARETYNARLAQLNFEQRAGQLVDAGEVRRRAFENTRAVRDALLGIPNRLGAELASETDPVKVQNILTLEITRILEELAKPASLPAAPALEGTSG